MTDNYESDALTPEWGSDAIALFLRSTDVPFIVLNPGASYRGLHDSIVNFLGDNGPQILMVLHEEHAVAIAHGYAKVTGEPLAVALHSNVGLMHASMAIYNAYADRVPLFMIGAGGPLDANRRRPWIDWLHTSADQPALVRPFIKWDDSPSSVEATLESLARAWEIAKTPPYGPTYVVLDVSVQEGRLDTPPAQPVLAPADTLRSPMAHSDAVAGAATLLRDAANPVILAGRMSKNPEDFRRRVILAERLGARVITDLKAGSSFPSAHPLHVPGPGFFLSDAARKVIAAADVVLALDWIDVAGTLKQAPALGSRSVVNATLDPYIHNGWSKDHFGRVPAGVWLPTAPDVAVAQLLEVIPDKAPDESTILDKRVVTVSSLSSTIRLDDLAIRLRESLEGLRTTVARLPLGWDGDSWEFDGPLDFLGYDGGGGVGSGPGMTIGAALASMGSGRTVVSVLGDGDYLMGVNALWTAAKYEIPLLIIVANNRSYFNDEVHQERVAVDRDRDVSRRWIGQRIDDPAPDLAGLARAQGVAAFGPVSRLEDLGPILQEARSVLLTGRPVVVDVLVDVGYSEQMAAGLVRDPDTSSHARGD